MCIKSAPFSLCTDVEVLTVARQRICFYHDYLSAPLRSSDKEWSSLGLLCQDELENVSVLQRAVTPGRYSEDTYDTTTGGDVR